MKILIVASEEWNDYVYPNGVLTNWFSDFPAEFAEIYTSPGLPINNICNKYFQITESQMVRSMLGGFKAGCEIKKPSSEAEIAQGKQNARREGVYGLFKKISLFFNTPVVMLRDLIWCLGRYNVDSLRQFVTDFNPDIVFCPRKISPKLIRLERIVSKMTKAPFVAFTGDDEASLNVMKGVPLLARIRKRYIHSRFKKHVSLYSYYLMHSKEQAQDYADEYGLITSTILKCGVFPNSYSKKNVGDPIRIVYAGRLYCNRWLSLVELGRAMQTINQDGVRMVLDIYTQEQLSKEQKNAFSQLSAVSFKGSVSSEELSKNYREADIALHVESLDEYYREITKVSFSTKIIDLLASSCAIMAICWEKHAGYQYLYENNAAFCISDYKDIYPCLKQICDQPSLVGEYARKAYNCGVINNNPKKVKEDLMDVFKQAVAKHEILNG